MREWGNKKPENAGNRTRKLCGKVLSNKVEEKAIIFDGCLYPLPQESEEHVAPKIS